MGRGKPGPPRSAILRRSSHRFPREVLIIAGRAAKASPSCLTDRHRNEQGQGSEAERDAGGGQGGEEKEEGKRCIFLKFHWLETQFQVGCPYRLFSTPRERVIGPPPTVFKKSGEICAKLLLYLDITSLRGAATETTVRQPSSDHPCRHCGVGG